MRVVVTGAGGYIGMHLLAALRDGGENVVALIRPGSRWPRPVGLAVAEGDVTDPALARHLHAGDRVVHLACLAMGPSQANPDQAFLVNTRGTFNLLRAATAAGAARVVVASSAQVYGRPERVPMGEDHPTRPTNAYGASKLAGEVFVPAVACGYADGAAVLRIFNVFGAAADGSPRATFETLVAERARAGLPVQIGSTEEARDFVHVDDVVRALVAAVNSSAGGAYNIGSGRACRLAHLATAAGVPPGELLVTGGGPEPPMVFAADIERARLGLGFQPTLDVVDFVRSLVAASGP